VSRHLATLVEPEVFVDRVLPSAQSPDGHGSREGISEKGPELVEGSFGVTVSRGESPRSRFFD
jgi:hypothetical protein